jgi:hypothetical protein
MLDEKKLKLHFQRFEMKYQFPQSRAEGIIPELLKYMEWDPYARNLPEKFYVVSSLYYDSAGLGCYYQKIAGERTRKKLRVRFYDPTLGPNTPVFAEIKRRYDTVIIKDRLVFRHQDCYDLLVNNFRPNLSLSEHDQDTLNEFLWLKLYNGMMPQVLVSYKRKPLISQVDPNFRVTFDYDIKAQPVNWLTEKGQEVPVNPGVVIMEVKFNNILPFWFHRIIKRYNLEQKPFSKYCNALETCRPMLASENFSEVFQQQLGLNLDFNNIY